MQNLYFNVELQEIKLVGFCNTLHISPIVNICECNIYAVLFNVGTTDGYEL